MTTTAHEDQFGEVAKKHIAMYSMGALLRRKAAFMKEPEHASKTP